jgi:hypothetical protein
MESTALQVSEPLTAADLKAQVTRIQEVMKAVMLDGTHYGTIPGCGKKPTLLKPGAEKLMSTFRLAVDPVVEDLSDLDLGISRFRVTARVTAQSSGVFLGAGVGECSSEEQKYAWREAVCKAEFQETDPSERRWKWKGEEEGVNQVKTHAPDVANTILKMAKKRALVDAILTVTAASDIFTQDLEDLPEEIVETQPVETKKHAASKTVVLKPNPQPIEDSAWFDMKTLWEESQGVAFKQVKAEFKVVNTKDLPPEKRAAFAQRMRELATEA